ncbi:MAG: UDP-glucose 4-epimerase GalE [Candidatus Latescibacterota bacterium]|nr:UDP-glucose 4-epimerase GalE [Candidatus Latescibacterota bacterium]
MTIMVTGGSGYIGSVTVEILRAAGEDIVVVDDFYRGHESALASDIPIYKGKVGDRELIRRIIKKHSIKACVHFAALTYVGESVENPLHYYENNAVQTLTLIEELVRGKVEMMVFSSTAATYGEPEYSPLDEMHPQCPENPYGWGKLFVERALKSTAAAHGLRFVGLRYFNAAGASEDRGEDHIPESHLIPNVLFAAMGRREKISVFGNNYATPDGTPIRDYVHVVDLAEAHILALNHLRDGGVSEFVNLGNGKGYSVFEVIETARRVTKHSIQIDVQSPRIGDPSFLVANSEKARKLLGWCPQFGELEQIVRSAWAWHNKYPHGYKDHHGI